jgi:hypothetical protein
MPGTRVNSEIPTRTDAILEHGYNLQVPDAADEMPETAGISVPDVPDVAALVASLREEIRRSGADPGAAAGHPSDRRAARDEAERLWPVSADRSLRLRPGVRGGVGTPVKAVLRKLMRWYVEPLAYDQRSFNAAVLRLLDDVEERLARLERELTAARGGDGAKSAE